MNDVRTVTTTDARTGTLTGSTQTISLAGLPIPCTVTLNSTNGSRAIQLIWDNASAPYTPPAYSVNVTAYINLAILAPVAQVLLTGQAGDTWSVR